MLAVFFALETDAVYGILIDISNQQESLMALIITANGHVSEQNVLHFTLEDRAKFFSTLIPGEIGSLRIPDGRVMLHVSIKDRRQHQRNKHATALAKDRLRADEYISGTAIVITEEEAGVKRDLSMDLDGKKVVIIKIDRRDDIEAKNINNVLSRLKQLSATREDLMKYQASIAINVSGYDSDPRELHMIPEVKQWFADLDNEWPYWGWFIDRKGDMLGVVLGLLCSVSEESKEQSTNNVVINASDLPERINRLFTEMIHIGKEKGLQAKDIQEAINAVHAVITARIR